MMNFLYSCALTLMAVLADAFIKKSALMPSPGFRLWLAAGIAIYAASGIGWFYVMKTMPLYAIGIVFSVVSAISLILVGVVFFNETLSPKEIAGVVFGIISLILIGWQTTA